MLLVCALSQRVESHLWAHAVASQTNIKGIRRADSEELSELSEDQPLLAANGGVGIGRRTAESVLLLLHVVVYIGVDPRNNVCVVLLINSPSNLCKVERKVK